MMYFGAVNDILYNLAQKNSLDFDGIANICFRQKSEKGKIQF